MRARIQLRHLSSSLAGVGALAALGLWLHGGREERALIAPGHEAAERRDAAPPRSAGDSWDALHAQTGRRVALVRSRYRIDSARGGAPSSGAAFGSGVLVQPTLVLTSSHLVRPWRDAFDRPWDELATRLRLRASLDSLSVELPDQEPVPATLFAIAGGADLALLQIPPRPTTPLLAVDRATPLHAGEEVAVLSHQPGPAPLLTLLAAPSIGDSPVDVPRPLFLTARVVRIDRDARRRTVTQVVLDGSAFTAGGGGAVLDRRGSLVGLTRGRFAPAAEARVGGSLVTTSRYAAGTIEVVPGEQIADFLGRVGVIADPRRDLVDVPP